MNSRDRADVAIWLGFFAAMLAWGAYVQCGAFR